MKLVHFLTDGSQVFVNPAHVTAVQDAGPGQSWIYLSDGQKHFVRSSVDETARKLRST